MTLPTLSFTADAKALAGAAAWAARRISSRPELPILAGMLLEVDDAGQLTVTGFDRTVANISTVPTERSAAGRVVVSGRLMAELTKTLPKQSVAVSQTDNAVNLVCGTIRCTLPTLDADEYPLLPLAPEPLGTVDAQALRDELERVVVAVDISGSSSPVALGGLMLDFGATIRLTGTDRYRAAVSEVDWTRTDGSDTLLLALVGGQVVLDLVRADQGGDLTIALSDTVISFQGGDRSIVATLMSPEDYNTAAVRKRIPARAEQPTVVAVADVVEELKRAALVLTDGATVELAFERSLLTVRGGVGTQIAENTITCRHEGPPSELRVNADKLADALSSCHAALAEITLNPDMRKPVLITAPGDDRFRHVLMPIRKDKV